MTLRTFVFLIPSATFLLEVVNMPAHLISGNINNLDPIELETTLRHTGIIQLDTAARYANGESERIIGSSNFAKSILIDTKINIGATGDNSLTPELIEKSLSNSLKVLGVDKGNILYCHGPDAVTPIAVQAKAFDGQYRRGRFKYVSLMFQPEIVLLTHHSLVYLISHLLWSKSGSLFPRETGT